MVGVGTTLMEAAHLIRSSSSLLGSSYHLIGGEFDETQLKLAHSNLLTSDMYRAYHDGRDAIPSSRTSSKTSNNKTIIMDLLSWNVTSLPLVSCSIDGILLDAPFGRKFGSHDTNIILYPLMLREILRVVKLVLLLHFLTHYLSLAHFKE
jgi:tRNA G10  N-methylase Trm11